MLFVEKIDYWLKRKRAGGRTDMDEFCYFVHPGKVNMVASAVIVRNDKILLSKPQNRTYYYPPGGLVEAGEDPRKTCTREVKEELGLRVKIIRPLYPIIRWNINQVRAVADQRNIVVLYYLAEIIGGSARLVRSTDIGATEKFEWVGKNDLKKYKVYPEMRSLFNEVLNKKSLL